MGSKHAGICIGTDRQSFRTLLVCRTGRQSDSAHCTFGHGEVLSVEEALTRAGFKNNAAPLADGLAEIFT